MLILIYLMRLSRTPILAIFYLLRILREQIKPVCFYIALYTWLYVPSPASYNNIKSLILYTFLTIFNYRLLTELSLNKNTLSYSSESDSSGKRVGFGCFNGLIFRFFLFSGLLLKFRKFSEPKVEASNSFFKWISWDRLALIFCLGDSHVGFLGSGETWDVFNPSDLSLLSWYLTLKSSFWGWGWNMREEETGGEGLNDRKFIANEYAMRIK